MENVKEEDALIKTHGWMYDSQIWEILGWI